MSRLIQLVKNTTQSAHITFYECRPGKLFDGIDVRLAIPLMQKGRENFTYFAGRYFRFFTQERPHLFQITQYVDASDVAQEYSLLKIENPWEVCIARKLFAAHHRIGNYVLHDGKPGVFYSYGFRYWAKALTFRPYFRGEKTNNSTGDKHLYLKKGLNPTVFAAILNSSLFYWYYSIYSDGHNFTKTVIYDFPFDYPPPTTVEELSILCSSLMKDLEHNAKLKSASYRTTGDIQYKEYYAHMSKPIIDQIDRVLAEHYGLTVEELDFIINYDIKYRMGGDADEADE